MRVEGLGCIGLGVQSSALNPEPSNLNHFDAGFGLRRFRAEVWGFRVRAIMCVHYIYIYVCIRICIYIYICIYVYGA